MKKLILVGVAGVAALAAAVALNRWYDEDSNEMPAQGTVVPSVHVPPVQEQPVIGMARVNQNGDVMISGRAMPGVEVTVLDGAQPLGQVKADDRGDWVFIPKDAVLPGTREITVEATLPDGRVVRSASAVLLSVPVKSE
ncbi:MAG: peptidase associated/transthyretin-like domain-containing protein [Alphaproteobacteria bacterium]